MVGLQNAKYAVVLKQQAATNGATLTSDNIDCLGSGHVTLIIHATTSDNATNNPATLKVQTSDTTDATNFADIAALVGDGASGFTIPNSPTSTTTAPFAVLGVDCRDKSRYLRVLVSPVTTQTFSVIAVHDPQRMTAAPVGTTGQNVAVLANG